LPAIKGLRGIAGERQKLLFQLVGALHFPAVLLDGAGCRVDDDGAGVAVDDERVAGLYLYHQILQAQHGGHTLRASNDGGV
jgi:hypothetical protein